MLVFAGVTAMERSVTAATVRAAVPEIPPDAAVIVVWPVAAAVASPLEPAALLMEATPGADEVQFTDAVRFCVLLSEYVPEAVNCWVAPTVILGFTGLTVIDRSVTGVLPPPPPPLQPTARARTRAAINILLDLIDVHSWWD
jgi:hypothetical protein